MMKDGSRRVAVVKAAWRFCRRARPCRYWQTAVQRDTERPPRQHRAYAGGARTAHDFSGVL